MDATNVLSQLTDTWSKCLDQYYDHVAEEHMKVISEKYNIPMKDLMLKSKDLKENIMKKLTNCMPENKKNDQVQKNAPKTKDTETKKETNLEKLGRKELQAMCKERNIPTKRKNADMVSDIKEYDLKHNIVEVEEEEVNVQFNEMNLEDGDELQEDEYLDEEGY